MKLLAIIFPILLLSACSTQSEIRPKLLEKPQLTFNEPAPLILSRVDVKYVEGNICLTHENFVALMNNMDMLKSYIEEVRVTLASYKQYYTSESTLESAR